MRIGCDRSSLAVPHATAGSPCVRSQEGFGRAASVYAYEAPGIRSLVQVAAAVPIPTQQVLDEMLDIARRCFLRFLAIPCRTAI